MAVVENKPIPDLDSLTDQLNNYHVGECGLNFSSKKLKLNTENDAITVADEIEKCEKLEFLNFDGNTIGIDAAKRISQSLSKHGEFKRAIWSNMFTGRTKEEIPPALEFLGKGIIRAQANLVELDLSDNAFGPIGVDGISELILSPSFHSLQELRLNNNGLGVGGGKKLAKALLECYKSSQKKFALRVFQAGRNRLENDGSTALAQVFGIIGTLVEITMPQNGIYWKGITALSNAIKNNPHLKILNFNDNTVQKKGSAALAEALPFLQKLETLNLGDCLLKTQGAISIARAISCKCPNLKKVILDHNEMNAMAGVEICKAMQNKTQLVSLNLNGNAFGNAGIKHIQNELKKNKFDKLLESLSDDEGENSENEDSDENDVVSDSDNSIDSSNISISSVAGSIPSNLSNQQVTIPEFLDNPCRSNFLALGPSVYNTCVRYLETSEVDDFLQNSLVLLLKISSVNGSADGECDPDASSCAIQLYSYLYDWARDNDKTSMLTNAILLHLRLIKAEDKTGLLNCNRPLCVGVLKKFLSGENAVPKEVYNIFSLFLNRSTCC